MTLQALIVLAIQASIFLTVFGFGLGARLDDVLYLVRRPLLLARSLVAMFLVMPLVAVAMVKMFDLRPPVEIVLIALAISPLPPLLPKKQGKAGGHAAYGLALMAIVGVLSIATVPVMARLMGAYFGLPFAMPPAAIATVVLRMVVLPLAAGLIIRAALPALADRIAKPAEQLATVLLGLGVVVILIAMLPAALTLVGNGTLFALVAFVAIGLAVGHLLGGPKEDQDVVLALSTGSRHPAIALAIARANFPDEPNLAATVVLYLLVGAIVGMVYMAWLRRRSVKGTPSSA